MAQPEFRPEHIQRTIKKYENDGQETIKAAKERQQEKLTLRKKRSEDLERMEVLQGEIEGLREEYGKIQGQIELLKKLFESSE